VENVTARQNTAGSCVDEMPSLKAIPSEGWRATRRLSSSDAPRSLSASCTAKAVVECAGCKKG
jgi:hypothetical protein